jgi:hypothetical protein
VAAGENIHAPDVTVREGRRALRRHRGPGGRRSRPFFAIKAGASGDITLASEATSNAFVLWTHPRAAGYTPSALVHQGRVYLVHDTGIMVVVAADTGKELYKTRSAASDTRSPLRRSPRPTGSISPMRKA